MQEKFNKNLEKVKQIIDDLDSFRFGFEEAKAEHKFCEGKSLLDECLKIINKKEFRLDEISLRSGKLIPKGK